MAHLIDFHCHLDLYPEFEKLVGECERAEIYTLAVTTTPRAWPRDRDVCGPTKYIRAALGLHPQMVEERWREIDLWEKHLGETRYVGEVGLDAGPRHFRSLERQKEVFVRVLKACAHEGDKVLSVHSVRAAKAVLDLVEEHLPRERAKLVLHWFSGSASEAKRAVELGCYFSINEQMLRTSTGLKLVRTVPVERMLTETDGPFTEVDGRPAKPFDAELALAAIASCLGRDVGELGDQFASNLKSMLDTRAESL